ncbi:MAG TPA: GGDEF domain-containing protein [Caulobacteraceae bacterium]|jgi:diguanylate cyclase|nr:GGDEF domain-containing protein [Caulobacteraceae bacterium]
MADQVESALRGPQAFELAHRAVQDMERRGIWPTPLNFELWVHVLSEPEGGLAREIERLFATGEAITEGVSEALAAAFLPKARLSDQIRVAGDKLNRELASVTQAIKVAQESSEQYGQTLAGAGRELADGPEPAQIGKLVETLSNATREVQVDTRSLEQRLEESTAEVCRLKDHLERVRRDATTDGLTGLANRKAFDDELARVCEEARTKRLPLVLAVLDIDNFKTFNDTWGHQTGDQVLRYVASVIGRMAPSPRFAARYGGEEFAMIFPTERSSEVKQTLERICREISSRTLKRRSTGEDLGVVTLSAGLADFRMSEEMASLVDRADEALYASKRTGRNRVTVARPMPTAA